MKKTVTYKVTGRGAFPVDMLRYDVCHPTTETDSNIIEAHTFRDRDTYTVSVTGNYPPTVGRWNSFGWRVEQ
jgi:hypothetical protein